VYAKWRSRNWADDLWLRALRCGESPGNQLFDFESAQAGRRGDDLDGVLGREMGRKEADRRQGQPPIRELVEESGQPPPGSCHGDAQVGFFVGLVQLSNAIGMHGRIAVAEVETTDIVLG